MPALTTTKTRHARIDGAIFVTLHGANGLCGIVAVSDCTHLLRLQVLHEQKNFDVYLSGSECKAFQEGSPKPYMRRE